MKRLPMRKIREALRLRADGFSGRQVAQSLSLGRATISDYFRRAEIVSLGWPLPNDLSDGDLERLLFPRSAGDVQGSYPQPDWALVHRELRRKGVTLALLWEEYRAVHPDGYGYSRFCELYTGWIKIADQGLILTFHSKTGWREVEIGRGSSDQTCPVHALEQYLHYSRIDFGPLFQRVTRDDGKVTGNRLSDKHVARLIKKTVRDAGIRSDLPQAERLKLFSGHSLRAGLATSANVDERYIQKQLGHASPEMTRRYQRRRDRFRVNLTKAAGL